MNAAPPPGAGILRALWLLATPPGYSQRPAAARALPFRPARVGRGAPPLCDVWLPDGPGPHPSVVVVHGGGFVIGTRDMKPVRLIATRLAEAGFAVASLDYRLILRGGGLDEALDDVAAADAWWRGQAGRFALDPDQVSILGLSAGGALALLHAAAAPHGAFARVVGLYGLYDFTWTGGRLASLMRRLLLRTDDRAVWAARSPVAHADFPAPLLLVHGTGDAMVPLEHAQRLAAARAALGRPTELFTLEGEEHGFVNDARRPSTSEAMDRIAAFLRATEPSRAAS